MLAELALKGIKGIYLQNMTFQVDGKYALL
jgi:hypothetical protein